MSTHRVKVDTEYVDPVLSGRKPFEVRRNDRAYQVGDYLLMTEVGDAGEDRHWVDAKSDTDCSRCRVRRYVRARISFVYSGDPRFGGLEPGHVVLGLESIGESLPITAADMDAARAEVAQEVTR